MATFSVEPFQEAGLSRFQCARHTVPGVRVVLTAHTAKDGRLTPRFVTRKGR